GASRTSCATPTCYWPRSTGAACGDRTGRAGGDRARAGHARGQRPRPAAPPGHAPAGVPAVAARSGRAATGRCRGPPGRRRHRRVPDRSGVVMSPAENAYATGRTPMDTAISVPGREGWRLPRQTVRTLVAHQIAASIVTVAAVAM